MAPRTFLLGAVGFLAGTLCLAAEFSADFTEVRADRTSSGKFYMKVGKIRREVIVGKPGILITRPDKNVVWMLNPAAKTYVEIPGIGDELAATADAQAAAKKLGEKKLVGEETVNGYVCDKYAFVFNDKAMGTQYQWISKKLRIVIKMESEGSRFKSSREYTNIKEESVPDSVFDLPPEYTKISLPGLK